MKHHGEICMILLNFCFWLVRYKCQILFNFFKSFFFNYFVDSDLFLLFSILHFFAMLWCVHHLLFVVCVCVCISVHHKGFSWLNRTTDVLPDIQASDAVLRKLLCVKNLCLHVIDNHIRDLLASNCARVPIKPSRAAKSKRQLLKISKNQR